LKVTRDDEQLSSSYDTGRFAEVAGLDLLDQVATHADIARIVEQMFDDLRAHPTEWENSTLERFLDALAASFDALPSRSANRTPTGPRPAHVEAASCDPLDLDRVEAEHLHLRQHALQR